MNKQNTNSTVEKLKRSYEEESKIRYRDGVDMWGWEYANKLESDIDSHNRLIDRVMDVVEEEYTHNSKLQESNEKYLWDFYHWAKEQGVGFGFNIKDYLEQYNKLNGGGK